MTPTSKAVRSHPAAGNWNHERAPDMLLAAGFSSPCCSRNSSIARLATLRSTCTLIPAGAVPAGAGGHRQPFFHKRALDARRFELLCQPVRFLAAAYR